MPGVEELQASCTAGEGRQQCSSVVKPLGHFLISIVPTFHVLSRGAPGRPPERSLVGDSPRQNRSDIHRQVDRQTVVCPCAGTLLSSEQGPAPPTTAGPRSGGSQAERSVCCAAALTENWEIVAPHSDRKPTGAARGQGRASSGAQGPSGWQVRVTLMAVMVHSGIHLSELQGCALRACSLL